jgi:aspartate racemase
MKTIGVLGGVGPQATMDFEARVHRESQRRIPPRAGTGYPTMVVYYHRSAPFVLDDGGMPILPFRLDPAFADAARRIGQFADFLVITSNAPHLFREELQHAAGVEVLSMIDATLAEVRSRGWKKIGVLGMGEPIVYTEPIKAMGLTSEILDPERRANLNGAILKVMEGRLDDACRRVAHDAVDTLRKRGVDGVILGCTEIPFLVGANADGPDLVNPLELLATAAVTRALE